MRTLWIALAGIAAVSSSVPAFATTAFYDLSAVDSAANLASGPYGTVSVEESGGSLIFTEMLNPGFKIHDGNSNHNAFSFSLTGSPVISLSNVTSGFALVNASSVTAPPFGSFDYALDCTGCGPGYGGGNPGPLAFTVTSSSGPLSLSSLTSMPYMGNNVYFASDLVDSNGKTGNVGGVATTQSAVPEPATWAMMLIGFGAVGGSLRRRKTVAGAVTT